MDKLQNALHYAEKGFHVFPCKWNIPAKRHAPLVKWGEDATTSPEVITAWDNQFSDDMYFCVSLQKSGVTILDIDNKKGKNGEMALFDLELSTETVLSEGFKVKTPSNGCHYYFRGASPVTVDKLGRGIDTPVMAPLPNSAVPGKGNYSLVYRAELAPVPAEISAKLGEVATREETSNTPAVIEDLPHHVAEATMYLQSAPPSLQMEAGDDTAYRVACRTRDFGLSKPVCLDLMLLYWYPRCQPNNKYSFVEQKVENAYRYALTKAGESLPESDFQPLKPKDLPRHISTYIQGAAKEREWVIKDWIPVREITSLYGKGGLGKSLIALQLAMAVSSGIKFLDMDLSCQMPSLYVCCEDSDEELHRRVDAIRMSPHMDFKSFNNKIPLDLWSRVGKEAVIARADSNQLHTGNFYTKLCGVLKTMPAGNKLLILDTLADFYAGSENDRSMVNGFVKHILGSLQQDYNCTILLIAHPSKANADEYSGSTAWENAVRTRLSLLSHENENLKDYRCLRNQKANYSAAGGNIELKYDKGLFVPTGGEDIVDQVAEDNKNLIMDLIIKSADTGTPLGTHHNHPVCIHSVGVKDINGNRMTRDELRKYITQLIFEGSVEELKGGKRKNGLWPT